MTHEYLSPEQVAEAIHKTLITTKRMLNAGTIRNSKVGRQRLVRRDWLDAYVEQQAEGGRPLRITRRRAS